MSLGRLTYFKKKNNFHSHFELDKFILSCKFQETRTQFSTPEKNRLQNQNDDCEKS